MEVQLLGLSFMVNVPTLALLGGICAGVWRLSYKIGTKLDKIEPLEKKHDHMEGWQHRQDRALVRLETHSGLQSMYDE